MREFKPTDSPRDFGKPISIQLSDVGADIVVFEIQRENLFFKRTRIEDNEAFARVFPRNNGIRILV